MKVGASPEMATVLEEIGREKQHGGVTAAASSSRREGEIVMDPDLDEFMESYCTVLERYRQELSKPFDEAATFLTSIETQLRDLCGVNGCTTTATTSGNKKLTIIIKLN